MIVFFSLLFFAFLLSFFRPHEKENVSKISVLSFSHTSPLKTPLHEQRHHHHRHRSQHHQDQGTSQT